VTFLLEYRELSTSFRNCSLDRSLLLVFDMTVSFKQKNLNFFKTIHHFFNYFIVIIIKFLIFLQKIHVNIPIKFKIKVVLEFASGLHLSILAITIQVPYRL